MRDAAVSAILDGLDLTGRTLINLTSGTPAQARTRSTGDSYLSGAIMTPPDRRNPGRARPLQRTRSPVQKWQPMLAAIGGTARYLGADPGRASAYDIALLDIFWQSVSGIVHGLALARAEGISGAELAPFGEGIADPLPKMIAPFAAQLDAGDFRRRVSTIASAEVSLDHIAETSTEHGIDAESLFAGLQLVRRAIQAGHGADGLARLAETLSAA